MTIIRHNHKFASAQIAFSQSGSGVAQFMRLAALSVQSAAQDRLRWDPRRIDTGNLINSIQIDEETGGGEITERVGTNVDYAIYIHEGRPGVEANPFLANGLIDGLDDVTR